MVTLDEANRVCVEVAEPPAEADRHINMAVAVAGWNVLAHVRLDGASIAAIDVTIQKACVWHSFHLASADLMTDAESGPRIVGIRDSDHQLVVMFSTAAPGLAAPRKVKSNAIAR